MPRGYRNGLPINLKHGHAFSGKPSPEYIAWIAMKRRCYEETFKQYDDYGGRGITVCQRWLDSFENFLSDMGQKPSPKHSLDRKDVDGNYEPNNCRWELRSRQAKNKRKHGKGVSHTRKKMLKECTLDEILAELKDRGLEVTVKQPVNDLFAFMKKIK